MWITRYAVVAAGGALGSMARYWVSGWAHQKWGPGFPYGTLIINVSGSFVIGMFGAMALRLAWSDETRLFVAMGFLGAYTTFSTFELETLQLIAEGRRYGAALANLAGSVAAGLVAVYFGVVTARFILSLKGH